MQAISLIDDTLWNLQGRYWFIGTKMPWTTCCCHNGFAFTMSRQSEKPKSNPSTLPALLPTEGWKTRTGPKRRLGDIWDHMTAAGAIDAIIYSLQVWWVNDGSWKQEGTVHCFLITHGDLNAMHLSFFQIPSGGSLCPTFCLFNNSSAHSTPQMQKSWLVQVKTLCLESP